MQERIFVNRAEAKEFFRSAINAVPDDRTALRVFHGEGGAGKSALCRELAALAKAKAYDSQGRRVACAYLAFDRNVESAVRTDPLRLLAAIRNELADQGFDFPGFDLCLAFVWNELRGIEQPLKLSRAWLSNSSDTIAEGVRDGVDFAREAIQEEVRKIPGLGIVLTKLSKWTVDKSKLAWICKRQEHVATFLKGASGADESKLVEELILVFAAELKRLRAEDERLVVVLLLDEYESIFTGGISSARGQEQPVDRALRSLLEETTRCLAVFFMRGPLPWSNSRFLAVSKADHYDVTGLERNYAEDWLREAGIEDEALRAAMIDSATALETEGERVYPVLLDTLIGLHRQYARRGHPVTPEMVCVRAEGIESKLREVVERVLRDHGDNQAVKLTFGVLCLLGRFDVETVRFVVGSFQTGLAGDPYVFFSNVSFVDQGADGTLSVHGKIAEVHRAVFDEITAPNLGMDRNAAEDRLIDHLLERGGARDKDNRRAYNPVESELVLEAAAIRIRRGADGYVEWLNAVVGEEARDALFRQVGEVLWRGALGLCIDVFGSDHKDTATSYDNLAINLTAQGRYQEAEPLLRTALEIRQRVYGKEDTITAASYNNVASNLNAQGRYQEAEPLHRKALDICHRVLGEGHPNTATGYDNLATNLRAQSRYQEAEPLYRTALEIRQRALGEEHLKTATSYDNLAGNLNAQGRYREAEPLHQRALGICQRVLGDGHPDTATSCDNLAVNLDAQGRYREAEPFHQKALGIYQRVLGEEHPLTASSYDTFANNLNAQGRYREAEPFHQRALAICQRVLGKEHPNTASSYDNLATNLKAQGRYQEAEPLYRVALEIRQQVLSEEHPVTAATYNNLATNLDAQGRYEEAEPLYRTTIDICERAFGEGHPNTATSFDNLATNLIAQGRYEEAEPLLRTALDICQRTVGDEHPTTRNVRSNLESVKRKRS
ncbi:tetratricopeptide repeat protein [Parvularcula dongshanensis]|uniref:Tetratricopeptide (TPR) repeat protein n=1 Tax=Parvularcula dongshanensis TaxID=1173995 RepID=A0A840I7F5_9PROT|nr:tetratricopeptide repeat protein [Parvularcula dongshanensis]MBB4660201.1 tetratricopeptide (TPR) repeat protein [Parvularcula dongshanensis]